VLKPSVARAAGPDVYLAPGALYAGQAPCVIGTLLGSCVGVSLWTARLRVGGLNHYLLPHQLGRTEASPRFGDNAMAQLLARVEALGAHTDEVEAGVFGGAVLLATSSNRLGADNAAAAWRFLRARGIRVVAEDTGGSQARRIRFDLATGQVDVTKIGGG